MLPIMYLLSISFSDIAMFRLNTNVLRLLQVPSSGRIEKCAMIHIPKKKKSEKCENRRKISLILHFSSIPTKIIHKKIERKVNINLDQFGFRKDKGTRESILYLWLIIVKMFRINKPTYIAFVDLEKAFNNLNWKKLFKIMKKVGIDSNKK